VEARGRPVPQNRRSPVGQQIVYKKSGVSGYLVPFYSFGWTQLDTTLDPETAFSGKPPSRSAGSAPGSLAGRIPQPFIAGSLAGMAEFSDDSPLPESAGFSDSSARADDDDAGPSSGGVARRPAGRKALKTLTRSMCRCSSQKCLRQFAGLEDFNGGSSSASGQVQHRCATTCRGQRVVKSHRVHKVTGMRNTCPRCFGGACL